MKAVKIIVERHPDAYVAYPLGVKGVVCFFEIDEVPNG